MDRLLPDPPGGSCLDGDSGSGKAGSVSAELPARAITPLRAVAYFLALLVLGTGALLVVVASDLPSAARIGLSGVSLDIAGVIVLLVHQPLGRLSISAGILVVFSFILPPLLIHET